MVWYLKLNLLNNTIKSIWGKLGIQLTGFLFTFPFAVSKIVRAASGWANMRFTRVWASFICNQKNPDQQIQYWSFILLVNRQVICSVWQMVWVVSKKENVFVTLHSQLLHTPLRLQKKTDPRSGTQECLSEHVQIVITIALACSLPIKTVQTLSEISSTSLLFFQPLCACGLD